MADTKFIDGLSVWEPSKNAPDFIICNLTVNVEKLTTFLQENKNEQGGVRISVKKGKSGKYYAQLDTYQKSSLTTQQRPAFNNSVDTVAGGVDVDTINPEDIPF